MNVFALIFIGMACALLGAGIYHAGVQEGKEAFLDLLNEMSADMISKIEEGDYDE